MAYRLGIDLGGTSAKIGLVDKKKRLVKSTSVTTSGLPKPEVLVKQISAACRDLAQGRRVTHVGIGVAGDIDSIKGVVRVSPNLGWTRVPLADLMSKHLSCRVTVDNDANAAAWGLYHTRVARGVQNVIVMTLGTGVGGGLIINGQLHRGATGSAGEVGHMTLDEDGPLCNCGNRGCLETYVGGPHLVRRARRALAAGQRSSLQKLFREDPELITAAELSKAAQKGDAYARFVWDGVGHALGLALGSLIYILNPDQIWFTGGIAQAGELILKPMRKILARRTFKTPMKAAVIRVAPNASNIGVVGAALL